MQIIDNLCIVNITNNEMQDGNVDLPNVITKVNNFINGGKTVDFQVIDNGYYNQPTIYITAGVGKKRNKNLAVAKRITWGVGNTYSIGKEDFDDYLLTIAQTYQAQDLEIEIFPLSCGTPTVLFTAWETV